MKLTKEEKQQLINSKTENDWNSVVDNIKAKRNDIYPNYLAREILEIYQNKFPEDKYKDDKVINRKSFISWLAVGWVAFAAATGAFFTTILRLFFPNVLFEPPQSFKIGPPDNFEDGKVSLNFKKSHNVWIVREQGKIFALSTVCTHLGCTPNWLETDRKFKCPCHGSGFKSSGVNFEGPAPRPLERYRIYLANDGQIVVDKTKAFKQEKGEWNRSESFLKV